MHSLKNLNLKPSHKNAYTEHKHAEQAKGDTTRESPEQTEA